MNFRVTFPAKNGQPEQTACFRSQKLADAYARDVRQRESVAKASALADAPTGNAGSPGSMSAVDVPGRD